MGPECQNNNLKMILSPVASFSQSFSPFELTATHFGPETVIFGRPETRTSVIGDLKSWFLEIICIANAEIHMYCRYKYMCQRCKLYVVNTIFYILEIYKWPSKFGAPGCAPAGFFPAKTKVLYFWYIESWFLCLKYIKHVLSKLCAPGCAPAFFSSKNIPSIFYE